MGAYLSEPKTDKISEDEENKILRCGSSSMQGWRINQEDAHNFILNYGDKLALFAVYDGHGGAEVAEYCSMKLPNFLKNTESFKNGDYEEALKNAFIGFDQTLLETAVVEELKILANKNNDEDGGSSDGEDLDEDVSNLYHEANLPLNEVLERYKTSKTKNKDINPDDVDCAVMLPSKDKDISSSPEVAGGSGLSKSSSSGEYRSKFRSRTGVGGSTSEIGSSSSSKTTSNNKKEPETSKSCISSTELSSSTSKNNASKSELPDSSSDIRKNTIPEGEEVSSADSSSTNDSLVPESSSTVPKVNGDNKKSPNDSKISTTSEAQSNTSENGEVKQLWKRQSSNNCENAKTEAIACDSASKDEIVKEKIIKPYNSMLSLLYEDNISSSSDDDETDVSYDANKDSKKKKNIDADSSHTGDTSDDSDEKLEEPTSGDVKISTKKNVSKNGTINDTIDEDLDDDDDDDDDDNDEAIDDDEDMDEDDDIDSEDEGEDPDVDEDGDASEDESDNDFIDNMINEPGKDSGCTAVVALLNGYDLYVANAGDSRCIVCRNGKVIEMSFDHKPEDDIELKRIENAGGKVTEDGRVNGGLNLSRAIGDHGYKMNSKLTPEQQMITALPDIKKITLTPQDEFMVLACDGIWNFMNNEQVASFVRHRLEANTKKSLSKICEELFDNCLAPNSCGDGTGCDNMTAIIVKFKPEMFGACEKMDHTDELSQSIKHDTESDLQRKRTHEINDEKIEQPFGKRQKVNVDETVPSVDTSTT